MLSDGKKKHNLIIFKHVTFKYTEFFQVFQSHVNILKDKQRERKRGREGIKRLEENNTQNNSTQYLSRGERRKREK